MGPGQCFLSRAGTPYTMTAGPEGVTYIETWPSPVTELETVLARRRLGPPLRQVILRHRVDDVLSGAEAGRNRRADAFVAPGGQMSRSQSPLWRQTVGFGRGSPREYERGAHGSITTRIAPAVCRRRPGTPRRRPRSGSGG